MPMRASLMTRPRERLLCCPRERSMPSTCSVVTSAMVSGVRMRAKPDEGSQFISQEYTQVLRDHDVKISMDGKGRYADNIFGKRLWRTVKYEEVYLKAYASASEARRDLKAYFQLSMAAAKWAIGAAEMVAHQYGGSRLNRESWRQNHDTGRGSCPGYSFQGGAPH